MADFNTAIEKVLREEDATLSGAVTNILGDSGGRTRFGISESNSTMDPSYWMEDVGSALVHAKFFYLNTFWTPLMLDRVQDQHFATEVLSFAINEGATTVMKMVQSSLNDLGYRVTVDGLPGPGTYSALIQADPQKLALNVLVRAAFRYGTIVGANPAQSKFSDGWIHRVENEG